MHLRNQKEACKARSWHARGAVVPKEVREVFRSQIIQGLSHCGKEFGFFYKSNGRDLSRRLT